MIYLFRKSDTLLNHCAQYMLKKNEAVSTTSKESLLKVFATTSATRLVIATTNVFLQIYLCKDNNNDHAIVFIFFSYLFPKQA